MFDSLYTIIIYIPPPQKKTVLFFRNTNCFEIVFESCMKYYQLKRKAALLKRNIYKSQFQINEQNKVS